MLSLLKRTWHLLLLFSVGKAMAMRGSNLRGKDYFPSGHHTTHKPLTISQQMKAHTSLVHRLLAHRPLAHKHRPQSICPHATIPHRLFAHTPLAHKAALDTDSPGSVASDLLNCEARIPDAARLVSKEPSYLSAVKFNLPAGQALM